MSEYNLGFSKKLADTAQLIVKDGINSFDAVQTIVYLSLLSSEITLKALLEQSGLPVRQIKKLSHDLEALLCELSSCEVDEDISGHIMWVPASSIRSITIKSEGAKSTVGKLLSGETQRVSKYPNQIRYGTGFMSFPPDALVKTAFAVIEFAEKHWDSIRQRTPKS